MKPKSGRRCHAVILSTCWMGAMLLVAKSGLSQGGDFPDLHHPIPDGRAAAQGAAEEESDSPTKTIYDKYGSATATPTSSSAPERRGRFTFGKRHETSVKVESKNTIQKTKDGSGDVTVPTGVFKDSLLDVGVTEVSRRPAPSETPKAQVNSSPAKAATQSSPSSSVPPSSSPHATAATASAAEAAPTAPTQLDITLGVKSAPNASATPQPH